MATRGSGTSRSSRSSKSTTESLQASVDRLAGAFDRLADRLDAIESNGAAYGAGTDDKVMRHVRRYMPFYALGLIFAIFLAFLPTRENDPAQEASSITENTDTGTDVAGTIDTPVDTGTTGGGGGSGSAPTAGGGGGTSSTPTGGGGGPAAGPAASGAFDPLAWTATGKTIGGFECKKGVRQIPWSAYALPCHPKWSGNNGGATFRGVTAKEIVIVDREFPETANSQAVEAAGVAAGFASEEVAESVGEEWKKYFNKVFELWGRKVKWITYESRFGDSTAEAQSKGKEGACADANYIVNELKAFAVIGDSGGSSVFAECAAERKLVLFWGGAYFPERWYERLHPYVWHTTMDCERISTQVAEYIGKRLRHNPAKWAKNLEKGKPRHYATYVPNNDEYQYCVQVTENLVTSRYGMKKGSRYNYTLDISRFPDEAAKGAIQFKAAGATTVIMACDPISMVFLTQSARAQNWFPEWFNIGVALNDTDNFPRTWDADEIRGSLFGMSQLGATHKLLGPDGEPAKTYKAATGTKIPAGTTGEPSYFNMTHVFNAIQAAGPNLTPDNLARGIYRLPPAGAPRFDLGYISFRDSPDGKAGGTDHTGIDDSREIYWDHTATGFDGERGAYKETYGGKRFRNGQWPKGDPPIYP